MNSEVKQFKPLPLLNSANLNKGSEFGEHILNFTKVVYKLRKSYPDKKIIEL